MFPEKQRGCLKRRGGTVYLLYINQHIFKENKRGENSSHGVNWLQKGQRYGSVKLDNILSKNEQNIRQCHKVYHEKSLSWKTGGKTVAEVKIKKRYIAGRNTFTICNSDDATQSQI